MSNSGKLRLALVVLVTFVQRTLQKGGSALRSASRRKATLTLGGEANAARGEKARAEGYEPACPGTRTEGYECPSTFNVYGSRGLAARPLSSRRIDGRSRIQWRHYRGRGS